MSLQQCLRLIETLTQFEIQLLTTNFNKIGCISTYSKDSGNATISGRIPYFHEDRTPVLGPWSSGQTYLETPIQRNLGELQRDAESWMKYVETPGHYTEYSRQKLERLYRLLHQLVNRVPNDGKYGLIHSDWGVFNILVDPEEFTVTGLIDWDHAEVRPLWDCYLYWQDIYDSVKNEETVKALKQARATTLKQHSPALFSYLESHRHISTLARIAWHRYCNAGFIVDLKEMWPETDLETVNLLNAFIDH